MHSRHQFKGPLQPERPAKCLDSSDRQVIINKTSLSTTIMLTSRNGCFILVINQRKVEMMGANQNYCVMRA